MATLKKDSSSWKARGIIKRDNQQDKSLEIIGGPVRKKHNKQICKRSPNKEHKYDFKPCYGTALQIATCVYCGKKNFHKGIIVRKLEQNA